MIETYIDSIKMYVKTTYNKTNKTLESVAYPFQIIDKANDLISIDIAKGKVIAREMGKLYQIDLFHRSSIDLIPELGITV